MAIKNQGWHRTYQGGWVSGNNFYLFIFLFIYFLFCFWPKILSGFDLSIMFCSLQQELSAAKCQRLEERCNELQKEYQQLQQRLWQRKVQQRQQLLKQQQKQQQKYPLSQNNSNSLQLSQVSDIVIT